MNNDGKSPSYQSFLETVPTLTDALKRTYLLGGFEAKEMAHMMGHRYADFNRYFNPNDARYLPTDDHLKLMVKSRNHFALDWQARQLGLCLYPLETMNILDEIRRALSSEGRTVRFALRQEGPGLAGVNEALWERLFLLAGKGR